MPRRTKVPTIEGGLVDYSCLKPYLHPESDEVPFGILEDSSVWENHHNYFPKPKYKQSHLPHEDRDIRKRRIWSYPYSQIQMPEGEEDDFHHNHSRVVPFPRMRAIEAQLRDYWRFDLIGAACLGFNFSKNPELPYQVEAPKDRDEMFWPLEIPRKERNKFFLNERTNAIARLKDIEITPELVVASIIKRLSIYLKDPYLAKIATEQLGRNRFYYSLQVPSYGHLYELSRDRLIYDYRLNTTVNFWR